MEKLIGKNEIKTAVKDCAEMINRFHLKYPDDELVFICVLNGGFMFFSDLVKNVNHKNVEVDFIRAKSYSGQEQSEVKVTKNLEISLTGKHVYLIDDILDSGDTIEHIYNNIIEPQNPEMVNVITLLKRKTQEEEAIPYLYEGLIEINDEWVYGYGMDNDGKLRNSKCIFKK